YNFSSENVEKILEKVTPKNSQFLENILNLGSKVLPAAGVITLLEYINDKNTNKDEVAEKLENFNNLKDIVRGFGFKQSKLADHIDKIPASGVIDIIKSDVLLRNTKHNFNSFPQSYNYVVKYYEHLLKKDKDAKRSVNEDSRAAELMQNNFSDILLFSTVFDESACNEILYNRGKYFKSVYMPRFKSLNENELDTLRKVQIRAVTEKENKGGDLAVYEISLDDKIYTLNLLAANRRILNEGGQGINFDNYTKPVNIYNKDGNFKIDFQKAKIDLMEQELRHLGIEKSIVDNYMEEYRKAYDEDPTLKDKRHKFWDINYVHLFNEPIEFRESRAKGEHGASLKDLIIAATEQDFNDYIFKTGPFAEINKRNKETFIRKKLNYDEWLHPTVTPRVETFINRYNTKEKTFTVRNWNRCPQESVCDGNYTTCCTGLDKDQGPSFIQYMQNTATTTLEVRTEKNKVIAMSRILMAEIDGKLSMIVENIEVNNKMAKHYLYDDETKYKFREMIFDYARDFAKKVNNTGTDMPVYFSGNYFKVKDIEKGLGSKKFAYDFDLIGEFPNMIYVNCLGGPYEKDRFADDGDMKLVLIDISKKARPRFSKKISEESDSNYNHGDTIHYK
ncbi:MAG: hypothetical protein MJ231_07465, partial [bacterium]|nr:hypothetical protein [bacterium]